MKFKFVQILNYLTKFFRNFLPTLLFCKINWPHLLLLNSDSRINRYDYLEKHKILKFFFNNYSLVIY